MKELMKTIVMLVLVLIERETSTRFILRENQYIIKIRVEKLTDGRIVAGATLTNTDYHEETWKARFVVVGKNKVADDLELGLFAEKVAKAAYGEI